MKNKLEIFIPVTIDLDRPTAQDVIECIKEQNERYGFTKFLLSCPGAGWRSKGYPQRAGCFLPAAAARELCARGFGAYIGVSVGEDIASGYTGYDLGAREVVKTPFDGFCRGKHMPIAHMYAPGGNGALLALTVTDPGAEVISEAYTFDQKLLCTAMTRFENALGGRVVVMGMTVKGNRSQSLFNYRRMRLFEELLKWCGADVPLVRGEPCVHLIFNRARAGEDFTHLLTAINLDDDALESLSLWLPQELRDKKLSYFDRDGVWKEADATLKDDVLHVGMTVQPCEALCLLFWDASKAP